MTIVAVSQRVEEQTDRGETWDCLDQKLAAFVAACGGTPVPVPNTRAIKIDNWLAVVQPAAIVLSGGNDIGKCPERDMTEQTLLTYAADSCLPVLGICRGMQMMGLWAGTSLMPVTNHVRQRHSLVGEITGEVNSFHTFALFACPDDFTVSGRCKDGVIEAIRHKKLPWEGWMWHPERENEFTKRDRQRMRALLA